MKPSYYYTSLALSALCAILSLSVLILGSSTRHLQSDVQKLQAQYQNQQEQINAGVTISQQVGPNLLKDMASVTDDAAMKAVLAKHGYNASAPNK
jgi:hypothetical protein